MPQLDIRTLALTSSISYAMLAVIAVMNWRLHRDEKYTGDWALGASIGGAAIILLGLRGVVPDFLSVVVANASFFLGLGYIYIGCRRFVGRETGRPWHWIAAGTAAPAFYWATYIFPSTLLRIELVSLGIGIYTLISAGLLLRPLLPGLRSAQGLTALSLGLIGLSNLMRAAVSPFIENQANFMQASASSALYLLLQSVAITALTAGLVMLVTTRLHLRLSQSEAQYRSLFETMPVGVVYHDSMGMISAANPAAERILGMTLAELQGRTPQDPRWRAIYEDGRDLPGEDHPASVALRTGQEVRDVILGVFNPVRQEHVWINVHATPQFRRGARKPCQVYATFEDITERKRAEEALREERAHLAQRVEERTAELRALNADLTRAVQSRDDFLAAMSHELRTPLTGVLGMAEILQMQLNGSLNDRQLQQVQVILDSGQHLLDLIDDVLDLAKATSGRLEMELACLSLDGLCQACLSFVRLQAHKKGLSLRYASDLAVTTLVADERRLKQILINLLGNAVKFTPEGGQVGLEVAGDAARREVRLTVWDTGIGMAAEDLPRLFQHFVQLDSRLARKYEGAGLGLALVKRMVELHGGAVSAESEGLGRGSRFVVTLPWRATVDSPLRAAAGEVMVTAAEPAPCASPPARPLVLIADDNPAHLSILAQALEAQGYTVTAAASGEEALRLANQQRPALLVIDIQMPGIDGLELIRRFRAQPPYAATPIVALTALAMPADEKQCLAAGANAYLSKPVRIADLLALLRRWLTPGTAARAG